MAQLWFMVGLALVDEVYQPTYNWGGTMLYSPDPWDTLIAKTSRSWEIFAAKRPVRKNMVYTVVGFYVPITYHPTIGDISSPTHI